ncbi:C40 family peptidase, partial [Arthrobacter sp. H14]|uniref:C40 family peptidase n=1 Tax=Arthrobacter sp. H14 TaxID=1312959 RepID=UPI0006877B2C
MTLACGLILGAGLVVQPAFPQQTATPQSQTREQASSVTAASAATLSFNLAPAVFSYPQSKVYPASFPDNFSTGQPGQPGLPGQPGTALKGDLAGVVEYAYAGLGRPYVWGGTSFISGWDCSGFVQWAYRHAGIELPRVSQWEALRPTTTPSPGDLVTQRPDGPNHWAHVGIYVGNGMMISALNPDEGTVLHPVGPEGSSWFFTTSVGGGAGAPSGLVAG